MPKYNVKITRTTSVEKTQTTEVEISAKDENVAEEKVAARVEKAKDAGKIDSQFDWNDDDDDETGETFDYGVEEL